MPKRGQTQPLKLCTFEGCSKKRLANRLCEGHNRQRMRNGKENLVPLRSEGSGRKRPISRVTTAKELAAFIANNIKLEDECWVWKYKLTEHGYGILSLDGENHLVHRVLYSKLKGRNIDDLTLDHLCRNRACCNPSHLAPVSRGYNTEAMLTFHNFRNEVRRLRMQIKSLGGDPGSDIFDCEN